MGDSKIIYLEEAWNETISKKALDPLEAMLEAISDEEDLEILQEQLQALGELFQTGGQECLGPEPQQKVVKALEKVLNWAIEQRQAQAERNQQRSAPCSGPPTLFCAKPVGSEECGPGGSLRRPEWLLWAGGAEAAGPRPRGSRAAGPPGGPRTRSPGLPTPSG